MILHKPEPDQGVGARSQNLEPILVVMQEATTNSGRSSQVGPGRRRPLGDTRWGFGRKTRAGICQKTREMPIYDRSIKVLRYPGPTRWRPHEKPRFNVWDFRPTAQGDVGFPIGRRINPNKPNRFKFWWVNQIDGFRPRQSQAIYLPCCQLDTARFGPVFEENGWFMTDQRFGEHARFCRRINELARN
jgi:hypothetical protein